MRYISQTAMAIKNNQEYLISSKLCKNMKKLIVKTKTFNKEKNEVQGQYFHQKKILDFLYY